MWESCDDEVPAGQDPDVVGLGVCLFRRLISISGLVLVFLLEAPLTY